MDHDQKERPSLRNNTKHARVQSTTSQMTVAREVGGTIPGSQMTWLMASLIHPHNVFTASQVSFSYHTTPEGSTHLLEDISSSR